MSGFNKPNFSPDGLADGDRDWDPDSRYLLAVLVPMVLLSMLVRITTFLLFHLIFFYIWEKMEEQEVPAPPPQPQPTPKEEEEVAAAAAAEAEECEVDYEEMFAWDEEDGGMAYNSINDDRNLLESAKFGEESINDEPSNEDVRFKMAYFLHECGAMKTLPVVGKYPTLSEYEDSDEELEKMKDYAEEEDYEQEVKKDFKSS